MANAHKLAVVFTIVLSVLFVFVAPGIALPRTTLRPKTTAENIIAALCAMIAVNFVPRAIAYLQHPKQERPALPADVLCMDCTLLC